MTKAYGRSALIDAGGRARVLDAAVDMDRGAGYKEKFLQELIYDHPECLPVEEVEPGFGELVAICTELPLGGKYLDNLFMTADGDLVIGETKLWRNGEARREVVAQALEYAAALFRLDYAGLETAVLKAAFGKRARPNRLIDLFTGPEALDEPAFIDAVNANLRLGRALILVVGDGIRSEAAQLAELLQSHAGWHFTFAMVELRVFGLPEGGFLTCPRILAQTEMIHRAVVKIDDQRAVVLPPQRVLGAGPVSPETISSEQFFEAMARINPTLPEKLRAFLDRIGEAGVRPEFRKSLNLKWATPQGREVNLGFITQQGTLWTDQSVASLPEARQMAHDYVEQVARVMGLEINRTSQGEIWTLRDYRVQRDNQGERAHPDCRATIAAMRPRSAIWPTSWTNGPRPSNTC